MLLPGIVHGSKWRSFLPLDMTGAVLEQQRPALMCCAPGQTSVCNRLSEEKHVSAPKRYMGHALCRLRQTAELARQLQRALVTSRYATEAARTRRDIGEGERCHDQAVEKAGLSKSIVLAWIKGTRATVQFMRDAALSSLHQDCVLVIEPEVGTD